MFLFTSGRPRCLPIICVAAALAGSASAAWAQELAGTMSTSVLARPGLAPPLGAPADGAGSRVRAGALQTSADDYGLRVVELPLEGPPGPRRRAHHALSFKAPAVSRMLDNLGLDGADCFTRLRLPSRLRQTAAGAEFTVQAQVALSCRF